VFPGSQECHRVYSFGSETATVTVVLNGSTAALSGTETPIGCTGGYTTLLSGGAAYTAICSIIGNSLNVQFSSGASSAPEPSAWLLMGMGCWKESARWCVGGVKSARKRSLEPGRETRAESTFL